MRPNRVARDTGVGSLRDVAALLDQGREISITSEAASAVDVNVTSRVVRTMHAR